MNTRLINVLCFIAGGVTGVIVAQRLFKAAYEEQARGEVEAMQAYYESRERYCTIRVTEGDADVSEEKKETKKVEPVDYTRFSSSKPPLKEFVEQVEAGVVEPDENVWEETVANPYIISKEDFGTRGYDTITLSYYYEDDLLCEDGAKSVIFEILDVVGDALEEFEDGVNTVYVRNPRFEIDYEINRVEGSFMNGES